MTDPIPWRHDESNVGDLERDVLRSDLDIQPPTNVSALVWGKLAGELGLGSAVVGVATVQASSHVAASGAHAARVAVTSAKAAVPVIGSSLAFVQGVIVGVLACGAVWAGFTPHRGPATEHAGSRPVATVVAPVGVRARTSGGETQTAPPLEQAIAKGARPPLGNSRSSPEPQRTEARDGFPAPSVATFGEVTEAPRTTARDHQSQLKEEAAVLRRARAQLHAGELRSALELLDESKRRFAAPELDQEREALLVELLARSGQKAAAAQRARAFLTTYPESPHAERLRAFATP